MGEDLKSCLDECRGSDNIFIFNVNHLSVIVTDSYSYLLRVDWSDLIFRDHNDTGDHSIG